MCIQRRLDKFAPRAFAAEARPSFGLASFDALHHHNHASERVVDASVPTMNYHHHPITGHHNALQPRPLPFFSFNSPSLCLRCDRLLILHHGTQGAECQTPPDPRQDEALSQTLAAIRTTPPLQFSDPRFPQGMSFWDPSAGLGHHNTSRLVPVSGTSMIAALWLIVPRLSATDKPVPSEGTRLGT